MDIGREIRKIEENSYSLRIVHKENKRRIYFDKKYWTIYKKSEEQIGQIYATNFDEKGRIYFPENFPIEEKLKFLSASLFGHLILFQENDREKLINIIRKREDTKTALMFSDNSVKRDCHNSFYSPDISINLKSILKQIHFYPEMNMSRREVDRFINQNLGDRNLEEILEDINLKIKRLRIPIPRFLLEYIGINLKKISYKEKIVLFKLKNEIEIWKESDWNKNVNKIIWLSNMKNIQIIANIENDFRCFNDYEFRDIDASKLKDIVLL